MSIKNAKKLLEESAVRKIKSVYIKSLDEFEKRFPDLADSNEYSIFRNTILNHGGDCIRALKQELHVFHIQYKPLQKKGNKFQIGTDVLRIFADAELGFHGIIPVVKLKATNRQIADAIRDELDIGLVCAAEGNWELVAAGKEVVRRLIPLFDKLPIRIPGYESWLGKVIRYYLQEKESD